MNHEEVVRNAVDLAKKQGVTFQEDSPIFKPIEELSKKHRFSVIMCLNFSATNAGRLNIDMHFNEIKNTNEVCLANIFINKFNEYSSDKDLITLNKLEETD